MLMAAVTPESYTRVHMHVGAYHRPLDGNFFFFYCQISRIFLMLAMATPSPQNWPDQKKLISCIDIFRLTSRLGTRWHWKKKKTTLLLIVMKFKSSFYTALFWGQKIICWKCFGDYLLGTTRCSYLVSCALVSFWVGSSLSTHFSCWVCCSDGIFLCISISRNCSCEAVGWSVVNTFRLPLCRCLWTVRDRPSSTGCDIYSDQDLSTWKYQPTYSPTNLPIYLLQRTSWVRDPRDLTQAVYEQSFSSETGRDNVERPQYGTCYTCS